MANYFHKQVLTRKPNHIVRPRLIHPLARDLCLLYSHSHSKGELTSRSAQNVVPLTLSGGANYAIDQYGRHLYLDATDGAAESTGGLEPPFSNPSTSITVMTKMRWPTTSGNQCFMFSARRPGVSDAYAVGNDPSITNHDPRFVVDGNWTTAGAVALPNSLLSPVWLVGRWRSGSPVSIYVYDEFGYLIASTSTGNLTTTITYDTAGDQTEIHIGNPGLYEEHHHYFDAIWARRLNDSEVLQVIRNPWQLLNPRVQSINFPVAGGTVITITPATMAQLIGQNYNVSAANDIQVSVGTMQPLIGRVYTIIKNTIITLTAGVYQRYIGQNYTILGAIISIVGTINDAILATVGGPSRAKGLLNFYQTNGATSNDLDDAEREFLVARGIVSRTLDDMWFEFLDGIVSITLTGSLPDMKLQWWAEGAPLV